MRHIHMSGVDIVESSSSGSVSSDEQMLRTDLESNVSHGKEKRPSLLVRGCNLSATRLKNDALFRTKALAFLATALGEMDKCIGQFIWIRRIQAGLVRVANDPFDITFYDAHDRNSPVIWESDRQSFIHNAIPAPVHSHNDYNRRLPLFEALGSGCVSVEADVHLRDSDLLVGHSSKGLQSDSTLRSMYLNPLQRMLEKQNAHVEDGMWRGIFNQDPQQTVVLLIDHKTAGPETFVELDVQLQPLRDLDYLTYWNGTERIDRPITIVASGDAPFDSVIGLNATHRDIFWDAKLDALISDGDDFDGETPTYVYNRSNSYFASTRFHLARLFSNTTLPLPSTAREKDGASSQIEQAKARGLIARYWDTPANPPNLREIVWRVLVQKQVGVMNMDDLGAVRARASGWGKLAR